MRYPLCLASISFHCLLLAASSLPQGALSGNRRLLDEQPQQNEHLEKVLQRYLSNDELGAHLQDFVKRCGHIAKLDSAGKSTEGRELYVLEISDRPGEREAEPNVKYVGNVHGDEPSGRVLLLALAEWLCANYESHDQAKRIVKDMHLFLMPSMNPDGFEAKTRGNKNRNDLNRDFPDRYSVSGMAPTGREEAETAAIMEWTLRTGFVASASFHEGAVLANYPWDGTPNRTTQYWACPDDATFRHLAKAYASGHRTMSKSTEFKDGITNGAAWYPIYGSMQDWNYVVGGCMELTLELSDNKWPPEQGLAALWEDNRQALLDYPLAAALGGLHGTVKGQSAKLRADRGQEMAPVVATVSVVGIDYPVRSREGLGDFYRPLAPGDYGVLVSAEGFAPFSANVTVPSDGSGAVLDVVLEPLGAGSGSGGGGAEGKAAGAGLWGALDGGAKGGAMAELGPDGGGGGGGRGGRMPLPLLPSEWGLRGASRDAGVAMLWGKEGLILAVGGALLLQGLWVVRHRLRWRLQRGGRSRGE